MPDLLTFKRTISNDQSDSTDHIAIVILELEETLRKIEEVKEFIYKGYDLLDFSDNSKTLKVKFAIKWR